MTSYTIHLRSEDGENVFDESTNTDNEIGAKKYAFDFSIMEEGEYELTFTYKQKAVIEEDLNDIYGGIVTKLPDRRNICRLEFPDFPLVNNFNPIGRATSTGVCGNLLLNFWMRDYGSGSPFLEDNQRYAWWSAEPNSNPPIRCLKPKHIEFRVFLRDVNNTIMKNVYDGGADGADELGLYRLTLCFKKV